MAEIIAAALPGIGVIQLEECGHEMDGEMVASELLGDSCLSIIAIQQQFHVGIDDCVDQLLASAKAKEIALGHLNAVGPRQEAGLSTIGVKGVQHSAVLVKGATAEVLVC